VIFVVNPFMLKFYLKFNYQEGLEMYRRITHKAFIFTLISLFTINAFWAFCAYGQSGRGRQSAPPRPTPTPKPKVPGTTVLGIPDGGALVKQDPDGSTSRFVLRNGLTTIIRERHSTPLVSVNVTVKAGTVNESDEMAGMAQLARLMILNGTAKRSGTAVEKEVARLGGMLTSQVSYDHTTFNIIAPAESYQGIVELLADLIQRPAFKPNDLKTVAQLVIIESRKDRSESTAVDKLYATAFTTNRLKRGSSVSESMLASVTVDQLQSFYQNFYHPGNAIVTVVGDIFSIQALGQVQLHFGAFKKSAPSAKPASPAQSATKAAARAAKPSEPAAAAPAAQDPYSPNPEEPPQDKLRYANVRADLSQSYITIGYRTPAFKADKDGLKELATMQMMAAVLGLGNSSRLWQGLREGLASRDKTSVAIETGAEFVVLPGAGMLVVQLRVDPDRIDRAEAEYFREIERFRRELLGDGELERARVMLEKNYYDTILRYEKETETLAKFEAQLADYRFFDSNRSRYRAVTAQDIQAAAAQYLTLANTTVVEYEPRNAQARTFTPEKFAELLVTFATAALQPIKPEDVKPAVALKTFKQGTERSLANDAQNIIIASVPLPVKDFSVLRGPRVYVREDKAQPTLSVTMLFQGGRLIEDQTTSGMTELMLRSMLKSTTARKADLIALELESYGGRIHIINEPDFFGYTLDVLSRNAENAVKLLLEIVDSPFFDKEEIAKERNLLLADQNRQRDDEEARAVELMWLSLYPGHPYGLPRYGLPEVIKTASDEKLEAWHGKSVKKQYPLIVLVGDTDGSALVSRVFSERLRRGELDKSIKVNLPSSPGPPQEQAEQRGNRLTAQAIGFRVPAPQAGASNDLYAAGMLAQLTSSGKLVDEMRDKQGLTDAVKIKFEQRLASGAFYLTCLTLPESESRAREAAVGELQRLIAAPPSDDEFEAGRNAAIGRYAIALQSHPERALEYAQAVIFGRKASEIESQPDSIRTVKKTDIQRIADSTIKGGQAGRGVVRGAKN
jgi:zinc protease